MTVYGYRFNSTSPVVWTDWTSEEAIAMAKQHNLMIVAQEQAALRIVSIR